MKQHTLTTIAVAVTAIFTILWPASMSAQRVEREMHDSAMHDVRRIYVNGDSDQRAPADSAESLLRLFYLDQYRQFHDPEAPHFMFMTNDANLAMGVGGKLFLRGWFDWNGSQDSHEFYPYNIAVPPDPTQKRELGGSLTQTRIFFTLLGRAKKLRYMAYIEAGFSANKFILRNAYVRLNDFTLGYTYSSFVDLDALVPTVDAQGPNGQVINKQILARYFHTFRSGWSVGGSVEIPKNHMTPVEGQTAACRSYLPDVSALGQYSWDGGHSHIRLSGMIRSLGYRDLLTQQNHNVLGWGAQLSGVVNIIRPLTLYFQGVVGQGIGSYQGDLALGNYDLVGDTESPGVMKAPLCMGLTAGVKYDFSTKFFACIGLGETQYYGRRYNNPTGYRYGLYGCANFFWRITPRFLAGIEYVTGKRKDFDGQHAGANRIDALLTFSF